MEADPLFEGPSEEQMESIKQAIGGAYLPAAIHEADDFLKPVDLFEILMQFADVSKNDLIDTINSLGFKIKNIDGELYIPVKYPC